MKRCPFCGEKIAVDASECKHCGKSLSKATDDDPGKSSISLDAWEGKRVPSWMMYLLVAASLFCLWIMFSEGCSKQEQPKDKNDETAFNRFDSLASSEYRE